MDHSLEVIKGHQMDTLLLYQCDRDIQVKNNQVN